MTQHSGRSLTTWRGQFLAMAWGAGLLALAWAATVYICLFQALGTSAAYSASAVAGLDAVSHMATAIQDTDARAADFLLTGGTVAEPRLQNLLNQVHQSDANQMDDRMKVFRAALVDAHRVMGGETIANVDAAYPDYLFKIRLEQYEYAHHRPIEARAAWSEANRVLLERIQPNLDRLAASIGDTRRATSNEDSAALRRLNDVQGILAAGLAVVMGVSLGLMVWRTHRVLHLWMLIGLAGVVGGQAALWSTFNGAGATLHALDDEYAAVRQMDVARQRASQANAAVSRGLVATDTSSDPTFNDMATHVQDGLAALPDTSHAASEKWEQYTKQAREVHDRAAQGRIQSALALDVGTASDVFVSFTDTLDNMAEMGRRAFEKQGREVGETLQIVRWWAWIPAVLGLLAFVLGLRRRLGDF